MASNKKKVLVPNIMGPAGWKALEAREDIETVRFLTTIAAGDFQALLRASAGVDGVILGLTRFGEPECALAGEKLRVVARIGVGYDTVDVAALTRRRIPLMVVGSANSPSVAEQALYMMMTLAKRGAYVHSLVRDGRWSERLSLLPVDLLGKNLLIVGFGRIGTRTAQRCLAMEMDVLVYDPYVKAETVRTAGCEKVEDLDAARLTRMKPTAYLVNTARGGIIDETALHAALTQGGIAGAGIDVFEKEPPAPDNPLLELDNVVTAPHMAGVTRESVDRMAITAVRNVLSVLDGKPIRENMINPEVLESAIRNQQSEISP